MARKKRSIFLVSRDDFSGYSKKLEKSIVLLEKSQKIVQSLFSVYQNMQKSRKSAKGLTENESDVLRSMLVFAASGLDSVVKEMIRDTLLEVTKKNVEVQTQLEKYIEKKIKTRNPDGVETIDTKTVSQLLATPSPYETIVNLHIKDLTSGSLQSKDELLKIAGVFAIQPKDISDNLSLIKEIFDIRNQIIHEMDINFNTTSQKRRSRNIEDMCSYCNELIKIGKNFILAVNTKL